MMSSVWCCSQVATVVFCGVPVLYRCSQVVKSTAVSPCCAMLMQGACYVVLYHSACYVLLYTCQSSSCLMALQAP